jgi:hypothetical protein
MVSDKQIEEESSPKIEIAEYRFTKKAFIAEIKHRYRLDLKELNHCREELKEIIYSDPYIAKWLRDACIKNMMHTEMRMNNH